MGIRSSTKVYHFDFSGIRFIPLSTWLALPREIARVINVAALLAAINTSFILDLLKTPGLIRI